MNQEAAFTKSADALILDFPAISVKNAFLLIISHPVYGLFETG